MNEVFDQIFTIQTVPIKQSGFSQRLFIHFLCGLFDPESPVNIIANRSDDIIRTLWNMSDFFDTSVNVCRNYKLSPIAKPQLLCIPNQSPYQILPDGPIAISVIPHRTILQVMSYTWSATFIIRDLATQQCQELMITHSNQSICGIPKITAFGYCFHHNILITHNYEGLLKLYNKIHDSHYSYSEPLWKQLIHHQIQHPILITKNICIIAYRSVSINGVARIDIHTGQTIWETIFTRKGRTICSPYINNDIVLYTTEYCIFRINIHTGDIISSLDIKEYCIQDYGIFYSKQEDRVYGLLYKKGVFKEKKWKISTLIPSLDSIITSVYDKLLIGDNAKNIHCIDKRNGHTIWITKVGTNILQNIAVSTCKNYALACGDNKYVFKIKILNGTIIWSKKLEGTVSNRVFSCCTYFFVPTHDRTHFQYSILS